MKIIIKKKIEFTFALIPPRPFGFLPASATFRVVFFGTSVPHVGRNDLTFCDGSDLGCEHLEGSQSFFGGWCPFYPPFARSLKLFLRMALQWSHADCFAGGDVQPATRASSFLLSAPFARRRSCV